MPKYLFFFADRVYSDRSFGYFFTARQVMCRCSAGIGVRRRHLQPIPATAHRPSMGSRFPSPSKATRKSRGYIIPYNLLAVGVPSGTPRYLCHRLKAPNPINLHSSFRGSDTLVSSKIPSRDSCINCKTRVVALLEPALGRQRFAVGRQ